MDNYLTFLEEKEKKQPNELLKLQISEYKNFIDHLVQVSNIMDKNFYIIIPFSPIENIEKGFIEKFFGLMNKKREVVEKRETFETMRSQLIQRADQVMAGLSGIGLKIIPLKTDELIELMFNSYNPSVFSLVDLKDINKLELLK